MHPWRDSTEALKRQSPVLPIFLLPYLVGRPHIMIKSSHPKKSTPLPLSYLVLSKKEEGEEVTAIGFCLYLTGKNHAAWLTPLPRRCWMGPLGKRGIRQ